MIEAPQFSAAGKKSGTVALPEDYFDGTVNEPVLHQAVKVYLANQRQGTHATKTRRWVTGGNQKPWRQKGTGRARQGTTRAPHWPGGGVVFGPHPRDYRQDIPKKVRQLARRSALNARAREGSLLVVDSLAFDGPKTARLAGLLEALGVAGQKVLILTNGVQRNVYLSGRNMPTVDVMPYPEAAAYDIIWADAVVVDQGVFNGAATSTAAEAAADRQAAPAKRRTRAKPAAKAASKKAAPKATAERKPAVTAKAKKAAPKKKGSE
jgi:large subunit ribosomal protein L4